MIRRLIDDARDVATDLEARRGRALLLTVGVALSTGALVLSLGVTQMSAQQISAGMAAEVLDVVTVSAADPESSSTGPLAIDAVEAVGRVPLVRAAGLRLDVDRSVAMPSRLASAGAQRPEGEVPVEVFGATSGYLAAAGAVTSSPALWALDRDVYAVAVLGHQAAAQLGIPDTAGSTTGYRIHVGGAAYDVVGVLQGGDRVDLASAVVVPYASAVALVGSDSRARLMVRTEPGAGTAVAEVVRVAVRPDAPESLTTSRVVDLRSVRLGVENELGRMSAIIGVLLLALTALLIANAMVVSTIARTAEIGLRRALGSSKAGVARLFLMEGGLTGLLGGVAGSALGVCGSVLIARANGWAAPLGAELGVAGPVLGLGVGVLASVYPALRAAKISPAIAIRIE